MFVKSKRTLFLQQLERLNTHVLDFGTSITSIFDTHITKREWKIFDYSYLGNLFLIYLRHKKIPFRSGSNWWRA